MTRRSRPVTAEEARKLCEAGAITPEEYVAYRHTPHGRKAKREPKIDPERGDG